MDDEITRELQWMLDEMEKALKERGDGNVTPAEVARVDQLRAEANGNLDTMLETVREHVNGECDEPQCIGKINMIGTALMLKHRPDEFLPAMWMALYRLAKLTKEDHSAGRD